MSNAPCGVPVQFFHYDSETFLVPMTHGEVQDEIKCLQEARKKVLIKGLIPPPPLATEERQNAYLDTQMQTLLSYISWPGQFGKPVVKRMNKEVVVTFGSELEANVFFRLVKNRWRAKLNIPHGFERLWVEMKPPLTRIHESALHQNKLGKHNFAFGEAAAGNAQFSSGAVYMSKSSNRFANQKNAAYRVPAGLYPRSMWSKLSLAPSPEQNGC